MSTPTGAHAHDEALHPRGDGGRWAEKQRTAPGPGARLSAVAPAPVEHRLNGVFEEEFASEDGRSLAGTSFVDADFQERDPSVGIMSSSLQHHHDAQFVIPVEPGSTDGHLVVTEPGAGRRFVLRYRPDPWDGSDIPEFHREDRVDEDGADPYAAYNTREIVSRFDFGAAVPTGNASVVDATVSKVEILHDADGRPSALRFDSALALSVDPPRHVDL